MRWPTLCDYSYRLHFFHPRRCILECSQQNAGRWVSVSKRDPCYINNMCDITEISRIETSHFSGTTVQFIVHRSMDYYQKDVTPLLTHWSYVFLALALAMELHLSGTDPSTWSSHLCMSSIGFTIPHRVFYVFTIPHQLLSSGLGQSTCMKCVVTMVGHVLVTWRSRDINAWISNRVLCILQDVIILPCSIQRRFGQTIIEVRTWVSNCIA